MNERMKAALRQAMKEAAPKMSEQFRDTLWRLRINDVTPEQQHKHFRSDAIWRALEIATEDANELDEGDTMTREMTVRLVTGLMTVALEEVPGEAESEREAKVAALVKAARECASELLTLCEFPGLLEETDAEEHARYAHDVLEAADAVSPPKDDAGGSEA